MRGWLKREFPDLLRGDRVELVSLNDRFSRVPVGTLGTITYIDALGTIHVDWDNGMSLGLVHEAGDRWRKVHVHT